MSLEKTTGSGIVDMTRRGLLKGIIAAASFATPAGRLFGVDWLEIRDKPTTRENSISIRDDASNVSKYAGYILNSAFRLVEEPQNYRRHFEDAVDGGIWASAIGSAMAGIYFDLSRASTVGCLYATAAAGTLMQRVLEISSAYHVAKLAQDRRFAEYGFDAEFGEGSSTANLNRNPEEFTKPENLLPELKTIGLGTLLFPLGHGYLVASPFMYLWNMRIAKALQLAYALGDNVKSKLKSGLEDIAIIDYLGSVTRNDLHPAPKPQSINTRGFTFA